MMKYTVLICLLLTGCYAPAKCIDGELWVNIDPLSAGSIYKPTGEVCKETK